MTADAVLTESGQRFMYASAGLVKFWDSSVFRLQLIQRP